MILRTIININNCSRLTCDVKAVGYLILTHKMFIFWLGQFALLISILVGVLALYFQGAG